jgi:hypothetical protein
MVRSARRFDRQRPGGARVGLVLEVDELAGDIVERGPVGPVLGQRADEGFEVMAAGEGAVEPVAGGAHGQVPGPLEGFAFFGNVALV